MKFGLKSNVTERLFFITGFARAWERYILGMHFLKYLTTHTFTRLGFVIADSVSVKDLYTWFPYTILTVIFFGGTLLKMSDTSLCISYILFSKYLHSNYLCQTLFYCIYINLLIFLITQWICYLELLPFSLEETKTRDV